MKGIFFSCFKRAFLSKGFAISIIGTMIMCYISARDYIVPDTNSAYIIDLIVFTRLHKKNRKFRID